MIAGIAVRDALLFKDRIGEIGTCFKSQNFRQDKGIVTVEEEIGDLKVTVSRLTFHNFLVSNADLRHVVVRSS